MRLLAAVILVATAFAAPAQAARGVPVGLFNVNNSVMNTASYLYALRFVPDQNTTLHRFISGFNLEGTDQLGGRTGYGDGDGGVIRARLVEVRADGTPDLSRVLAQETVGAWQRYQESKSVYGAPGLTQLLYFNFGGVQVTGGKPYAVVYSNAAANPSANWFSENSPTVKESEAGPNGTNTLDPNAPGAIAGLDPREAVAWSKDGGASWVWGRRVGEGSTSGAYAGSSTGDDGTRLPWYGWQSAVGAKPVSNQPYYAYTARGAYTLRLGPSPRSVNLTDAGGYAPAGYSAGVVTVRNLSTGETGRTALLGTGIVKGALDNPVEVAAGQSYEISNSGTVLKAEGDSFIVSTFGVGGGAWPFTTSGQGYDRAELFALPHPFYAQQAAPPPPPAGDTTAPDTGIDSGPSGTTSSSSASFAFSASEAGASFECRLDGSSWSACASPRVYSGLAAGAHSFDVRAKDAAGNLDASPASRAWTIASVAPPPSGLSGDLARGRVAAASSVYKPKYTPARAVDGDANTRWASKASDGQWWQVDLGAVRQVDRVSLNWEDSYAKRYRVLTSTDGVNYGAAADVAISQAGRQLATFGARGARYVRIVCLERRYLSGSCSFWDAEVYGPLS